MFQLAQGGAAAGVGVIASAIACDGPPSTAHSPRCLPPEGAGGGGERSGGRQP
jgi:hypothetical protein